MLATYETPSIIVYGRVNSLTNSFKCTPGPDSDETSTVGDADTVETNPNTNNQGDACVPFPTGDSIK